MKTYVYIDGFNLYYNLFRGKRNKKNRCYKWLNLESLVEEIIFNKYKKNRILSVKYYTAHVSGAKDPEMPIRQNAYLRALELTCKKLEIVKGQFLVDKAYRGKVEPKQGEEELVKVYLPEEKGSDVNLSVHMVYEACQNKYDVAAVLTNDTDMSEAFRIVSQELHKKIILIQPNRVRTAKKLKKYCFDILRISEQNLANNQLPEKVGPKIYQPEEWK